MTVAEVLAAAADIARQQKTFKAAKQAGWSGCHAERDLIRPVFEAWARSEDITYLYDLGPVLGRRYRTPDEIVASLRRAAELAGST